MTHTYQQKSYLQQSTINSDGITPINTLTPTIVILLFILFLFLLIILVLLLILVCPSIIITRTKIQEGEQDKK